MIYLKFLQRSTEIQVVGSKKDSLPLLSGYVYKCMDTYVHVYILTIKCYIPVARLSGKFQ